MIKRLSTAAICVALVSAFNPAQAAPDRASDDIKQTDVAKAPDFRRPEAKEAPRVSDAKGAPRKCLTKAARDLLEKVEARFGPVRVISTCRPGARIAGSGRISRHASGNAVDFDAGKRKGAIINWLVANHKKGGTMTYADMSHIHIDIGPHFVSLAGGRKTASRSRSSSQRYADSGRRSYRGSSRSSRSRYEVAYERGYASSGYGGGSRMGRYTNGYAALYR
jgi:hypothetical protein